MQNTIETLVKAIQLHKPVEFEYIKEGKPPGKRIGNPHAVFEDTTRDGVDNIYTHIVQTSGVSESITVFPKWRLFFIDNIINIRILEEEQSFTIQEGYNPHSTMYSRAIQKI